MSMNMTVANWKLVIQVRPSRPTATPNRPPRWCGRRGAGNWTRRSPTPAGRRIRGGCFSAARRCANRFHFWFSTVLGFGIGYRGFAILGFWVIWVYSGSWV